MLLTVVIIVALLATAAYCYAIWLLHQTKADNRARLISVMGVAFVAHTSLVVHDFGGLLNNVSVIHILALVSLSTTLLGAVRYVTHNDRIAYPVVALLAAISLWLPMAFSAPVIIAHNWLLLHIILSIAAYISVGFAALYACFLLLQDYRLRRGSGGFNLAISLNDIEQTMMSFTRFGEFLLTLSLATGVLFIHDIWAQHVAHKIFFGAISWLIIGILLLRHRLRGFRGRPAALWLLGGFVCLVLAYFGTAFVLQIILR